MTQKQIDATFSKKKKKQVFNNDFIIAEGEYMPVNRRLFAAIGNIEAAMYWMRLIDLQNYFVGAKKRGRKHKGRYGWFYAENDQMKTFLKIGRDRLSKAKKRLLEMGLIATARIGNKQYFWIYRIRIKKLIQRTNAVPYRGKVTILYNHYR